MEGTQEYHHVITAAQKVFDVDYETAKEVIGLELKTLGKDPNDVGIADLYSIINSVVNAFCNGNGGSVKAIDQMYLQLSYLREEARSHTKYS